MANQDIEQRVAALEAQAQGGQQQGGGGQQAGGGQGGEGVEGFLAGALTAYAASQQQGQGQGMSAGVGGGGGQGIFGWNPTRYDSVVWCRSRFMCNPQSLSCLC